VIANEFRPSILLMDTGDARFNNESGT